MKNLIETEWTDYRDSVYQDPDDFPLDLGDLQRAFFAGATALISLLADHAHDPPDETVAQLQAELRAFAARLGEEAGA